MRDLSGADEARRGVHQNPSTAVDITEEDAEFQELKRQAAKTTQLSVPWHSFL